ATGRYPIPGGEIILHQGESGPPQATDAAPPRVYNTKGSGLDLAILDHPLRLCNWKPGDGYRPLGAARSYKLKEMFQKARIPSWERPLWPILWNNGSIIWARQFGPAADAASSAVRAVCVDFHPTDTEMQSR
ncbi:MAG: tRNA lysidine(34) synthetase TilS, partial [Acidobacteria bacterium]|nr:tRNA lysidine(34) synthetase TilS [Acidobacteriota bacterium]